MMSWSQDLAQLLHKVADHDGLGQKAVHAALQCVAAVLAATVNTLLTEIKAGNFANYGGKIDTLGLVSANPVKSPTTWAKSL